MALPEVVQSWPTRRQIDWVLRQVTTGRITSDVAANEMHAIVRSDRERVLQIHVCSFREDI